VLEEGLELDLAVAEVLLRAPGHLEDREDHQQPGGECREVLQDDPALLPRLGPEDGDGRKETLSPPRISPAR